MIRIYFLREVALEQFDDDFFGEATIEGRNYLTLEVDVDPASGRETFPEGLTKDGVAPFVVGTYEVYVK